MIKNVLMFLLGMSAAVPAVPERVHAQQEKAMNAGATRTMSPGENGHAEINGVNYYYEIQGAGEPLLLLHGGLGSIDMFDPILPILTEGRQVIGVDLHGHGRTALGDRPISLIDMGDDLAALLTELGYAQVDVLGIRSGPASPSVLPCSIPVRSGGWRWCRLRTRGTGSFRKCCRSRHRWAPAWPK